MSGQRPSVGRVVHYVSHGTPIREDGTQAYTAECRAAIVTEVETDDLVGLSILNPTGMFFARGVEREEAVGWTREPGDPRGTPATCDESDHAGGTWHWPRRLAV